ncbi:sigma-54 dependent transcriptional regulator [Nitrospiraceae bacterium AH_259_D15_M11_P09]|nr:sigma-54 dependent transcriptional regulator [Nitrospiraceae bacterium AH_259_D15_M11_P09]
MDGKILIIDDEPEVVENCHRLLSSMGYQCLGETDPTKALGEIERERPALILTDLKMPGLDGVEVIREAKKIDPNVSVVMFTAYATVQTAVEAMREGAFDYIQKPFSSDELDVVVQRAFEHRNLVEENSILRGQLQERFRFENVVGVSEKMQEVYELIHKVAKSQANILICGESGTGKELIARTIHANSDRAGKPFVPIDCGSLTETLLESELFGHEKGAFTGAHMTKPGLFEVANGGTVFLDEVAGMSLTLQSRLLRVLQERQVRRVGGTRFLGVDVRVISSSSRDLEEEEKNGRFRADLFYRLNVVLLSLPSLRTRNGDIPLLAACFLKQFAEANHREIKEIDPRAIRSLEEYHWPGNVRELQNVIERAVAIADSPVVLPEHLPDRVRYRIRAGAGLSGDGSMKASKQTIIGAFERNYLVDLLKKHHGHIGHSAHEAGVDRKTIERLLKKHGLKANGL